MSQYYEAVLQLRNPRSEVEGYVLDQLMELITKVEKVRNGMDYYVKEKKAARKTARKIRERFGGQFTHTSTLHTKDRQTSKEIYRDTILVRLPDFGKGDILKIGESLLKVTGVGKKVSGMNLKTGKKEVHPLPEDPMILEKQKTRVVKKHPGIEVMHPETYQPAPLQNEPDDELQVNEKVRVVVDKGVYLV